MRGRVFKAGLTALAACGLAAAGFGQATVATFADPSTGTPPLFWVTDTTVLGSWTGNGLTLDLFGTNYNNVQMNMPTVGRAGNLLGPGVVFFSNGANPNLFAISFTSGFIGEPTLLSGQNSIFANNGVQFYYHGSLIPGLSQQQFAFSFANPLGQGTALRTYTGSLTSSAFGTPEPFTLVLGAAAFGLGMYRRRRRAD